MKKLGQLYGFLGWWLVFIVLFFGAFRSSIIAEKVWTNGTLVNFNKLHKALFWGEIPLNGRTSQLESFLQYYKEHDHTNLESTAAQSALGFTLITQNRPVEAQEILQEANISLTDVFAIQGNYAVSVNSIEHAQTWYYKAVDLDPERKDIWHEIGLLHQIIGESDKAILAFQQSWRLHNADSADLLARLLRNEGRFEEAIKVWEEALSIFDDHPRRLDWWRGISNSLRATEQWETLAVTTRAAVNEFPHDARLYVEMGYALYYAQNDYGEAVESLHEAIALDEGIASAYAAMGHILSREGDFADAVSWYTRAISKDSSNRAWYLSRAVAARASGNVESSLELFQEIIIRYPDWALAHYQTALAYHLNGNPEDAIISIERALKLLDNQNPQYFVRAGIIYESHGQTSKAMDFFKRALLLDPDNRIAQQGINRLSED